MVDLKGKNLSLFLSFYILINTVPNRHINCDNSKIKNRADAVKYGFYAVFLMVAGLGFEPRQTESESVC